MIEEVRVIKNFPNYLITNTGYVISLNTFRLMSPPLLPNGYFQVSLYNNGKHKRKMVHRLVAEAFIPNPKDLRTVDHIDNDKQNNHVSNLRWMRLCDNLHRKSKSGLPMGVHYSGYSYHGKKKVNGKFIVSKACKTPEEAHELYLSFGPNS